MPNYTQIDNPKGAFGYLTTLNTPLTPLHGQVTMVFRNMSTAFGIPAGAVVQGAFTTSTAAGVNDLSTVDEGCYVSTVIGNPHSIGVALTSAAPRTTGTTVSGANAPSSEYCVVCVQGPVYGALLSTVATAPIAGSYLIAGNATLSGGSTLVGAAGGTLVACDTVSIAGTSLGRNIGIVGRCLVPGTTGTTGFLTTVGNRGVIWVSPSLVYFPGSTG